MKITPGVTWSSGDTVNHTQLNAFLTNAVITSGALDQVALGENALDTLTSGTDNVGIGDDAGTALTDGDNNVMVGTDTLKAADSAENNVAIGYGAMSVGVGEPNFNIAIGQIALQNVTSSDGTDGRDNVAVGRTAGQQVTTGKDNVFVGAACGISVTTGYDNTFVGDTAGALLTTDSYQNTLIGASTMNTAVAVDRATAVGAYALQANTADLNVAVGYGAGTNNTSGDDNTYVGSQAGWTNITGADNTFMGDNAGYYVTGSNNTALGSQTMSTSGEAAYNNTTGLGYGVVTTASNQVRLGNASVTTLHCQVGITADSDKRIKKSVKNSKIGLDFVNALRPVSYKKINPFNWPDEIKEGRFKGVGPDGKKSKKPDDDPTTYSGFIAQEVKAVMDEQGVSDWDGWSRGNNSMEYLTATSMIGPLVKAIQELSAKVVKLEAKA